MQPLKQTDLLHNYKIDQNVRRLCGDGITNKIRARTTDQQQQVLHVPALNHEIHRMFMQSSLPGNANEVSHTENKESFTRRKKLLGKSVSK